MNHVARKTKTMGCTIISPDVNRQKAAFSGDGSTLVLLARGIIYYLCISVYGLLCVCQIRCFTRVSAIEQDWVLEVFRPIFYTQFRDKFFWLAADIMPPICYILAIHSKKSRPMENYTSKVIK